MDNWKKNTPTRKVFFDIFNASSCNENLDRFKFDEDAKSRLIEDILTNPHHDSFFPKFQSKDFTQKEEENTRLIEDINKDKRSMTCGTKVRPVGVKSVYLSANEK